jgi:hypothetical protein
MHITAAAVLTDDCVNQRSAVNMLLYYDTVTHSKVMITNYVVGSSVHTGNVTRTARADAPASGNTHARSDTNDTQDSVI